MRFGDVQKIKKKNKKTLYCIKKEYMHKVLFKPLAEGKSKPFYSYVKISKRRQKPNNINAK